MILDPVLTVHWYFEDGCFSRLTALKELLIYTTRINISENVFKLCLKNDPILKPAFDFVEVNTKITEPSREKLKCGVRMKHSFTECTYSNKIYYLLAIFQQLNPFVITIL